MDVIPMPLTSPRGTALLPPRVCSPDLSPYAAGVHSLRQQAQEPKDREQGQRAYTANLGSASRKYTAHIRTKASSCST